MGGIILFILGVFSGVAFAASPPTDLNLSSAALKSEYGEQFSKKRKFSLQLYHDGYLKTENFDSREDTYLGDNRAILSYRLAKTQSLAFSYAVDSDFAMSGKGEEARQYKVGDPYIQFKEKNLGKLLGRYKVSTKNRLSAPVSERSKERGMITRFKGELALADEHRFLPKTFMVYYLTPSFWINEAPTYQKRSGDSVSVGGNPLWQVFSEACAVHDVTPQFSVTPCVALGTRWTHSVNGSESYASNFDLALRSTVLVAQMSSLDFAVGRTHSLEENGKGSTFFGLTGSFYIY